MRLALVLACWLGALLPAAALDWEIERSFRYFVHPSDVAVQRLARDLLRLAGTADPSVEEIERSLNGGGFWSLPLPAADARPKPWPASWRDPALRTTRDLLVRLRGEEGRPGTAPPAAELDRLGWASLLVDPASDATATCWNPVARMHTGCRDHGDYARPQGWIVRVFDPDAPAGETCSWSGADPAGPAASGTRAQPSSTPSWPGDCREVRIHVPAAPDGPEVRGSVTVVRTRPGQAPETLAIAPGDRLIVGFGDSFTSGEGNPERPAAFLADRASEPLFLPQRASAGLEAAAHWTDRACHRSVYSWQVRTALGMALADPKVSVTLLPYGCSGAEITEGLVYGYRGVEPGAASGAVLGHPAQIGLAYQELCAAYVAPSAFPAVPERERDTALAGTAVGDPDRIVADASRHVARCGAAGPDRFKRRIDAVLIGIGVNDMGFSRWVAGALLTGAARDLAKGFVPQGPAAGGACDAACRETGRRTERLRGRFAALRRILDERFLPAGQVAAGRVFVELYPAASEDETGTTCGAGNGGLTATAFNRTIFGRDEAARRCEGGLGGVGATIGRGTLMAVRDPAALQAVERFRESALNTLVRGFASRSGHDFAVVDGYLPRFAARGFCASRDPQSGRRNPPCWAFSDLMDRVDPIACQVADPACRSRRAETLHVPRFVHGAWRPLSPAAEGAYWPRTRLYRTPNDVFTLINKRGRNVLDTSPIGPLDLADRATGGAFHPTAEGHAIVADAVRRKAAAPSP